MRDCSLRLKCSEFKKKVTQGQKKSNLLQIDGIKSKKARREKQQKFKLSHCKLFLPQITQNPFLQCTFIF